MYDHQVKKVWLVAIHSSKKFAEFVLKRNGWELSEELQSENSKLVSDDIDKRRVEKENTSFSRRSNRGNLDSRADGGRQIPAAPLPTLDQQQRRNILDHGVEFMEVDPPNPPPEPWRLPKSFLDIRNPAPSLASTSSSHRPWDSGSERVPPASPMEDEISRPILRKHFDRYRAPNSPSISSKTSENSTKKLGLFRKKKKPPPTNGIIAPATRLPSPPPINEQNIPVNRMNNLNTWDGAPIIPPPPHLPEQFLKPRVGRTSSRSSSSGRSTVLEVYPYVRSTVGKFITPKQTTAVSKAAAKQFANVLDEVGIALEKNIISQRPTEKTNDILLAGAKQVVENLVEMDSAESVNAESIIMSIGNVMSDILENPDLPTDIQQEIQNTISDVESEYENGSESTYTSDNISVHSSGGKSNRTTVSKTTSTAGSQKSANSPPPSIKSSGKNSNKSTSTNNSRPQSTKSSYKSLSSNDGKNSYKSPSPSISSVREISNKPPSVGSVGKISIHTVRSETPPPLAIEQSPPSVPAITYPISNRQTPASSNNSMRSGRSPIPPVDDNMPQVPLAITWPDVVDTESMSSGGPPVIIKRKRQRVVPKFIQQLAKKKRPNEPIAPSLNELAAPLVTLSEQIQTRENVLEKAMETFPNLENTVFLNETPQIIQEITSTPTPFMPPEPRPTPEIKNPVYSILEDYGATDLPALDMNPLKIDFRTTVPTARWLTQKQLLKIVKDPTSDPEERELFAILLKKQRKQKLTQEEFDLARGVLPPTSSGRYPYLYNNIRRTRPNPLRHAQEILDRPTEQYGYGDNDDDDDGGSEGDAYGELPSQPPTTTTIQTVPISTSTSPQPPTTTTIQTVPIPTPTSTTATSIPSSNVPTNGGINITITNNAGPTTPTETATTSDDQPKKAPKRLPLSMLKRVPRPGETIEPTTSTATANDQSPPKKPAKRLPLSMLKRVPHPGETIKPTTLTAAANGQPKPPKRLGPSQQPQLALVPIETHDQRAPFSKLKQTGSKLVGVVTPTVENLIDPNENDNDDNDLTSDQEDQLLSGDE